MTADIYTIYADGKLLYTNEVDDEDATVSEPILSLEMGKAGSLEFVVTPFHYLYDQLMLMKTKLEVRLGDEVLFRGRVLRISTDMYREKSIYAEGCLTYLTDTTFSPYSKTVSVAEFVEECVRQHNANADPDKQLLFGNVTIAEKDKKELYDIDGYSMVADVLEEYTVNRYGGYLRIRYEEDGSYLDYLEDYGTTCEQVIKFGENIVDFQNEESGEDMFTALLPLGDNDLTVKSVKENGGSIFVKDEDAVNKHGTIVKTVTFTDVTSAATLYKKAKEYMDANLRTTMDDLTVKALDLHLLDTEYERIRVGDQLHVLCEPHDFDKMLTCLSQTINIQNPENSEYKIGIPPFQIDEESTREKSKRKTSVISASNTSLSSQVRAATTSAYDSESTLKKYFKFGEKTLTIKCDTIMRLQCKSLVLEPSEKLTLGDKIKTFRIPILTVTESMTAKDCSITGFLNVKNIICGSNIGLYAGSLDMNMGTLNIKGGTIYLETSNGKEGTLKATNVKVDTLLTTKDLYVSGYKDGEGHRFRTKYKSLPEAHDGTEWRPLATQQWVKDNFKSL